MVVALLLGGTWINRLSNVSCPYTSDTTRFSSVSSDDLTDKIMDNAEDKPSTTAGTDDGSLSTPTYRSSSPSLLLNQERPWRIRRIGLWLWKREIITPNTAKFRNRCFSRFLRRFPFLVECWYWTLVYWVCALYMSYNDLRRNPVYVFMLTVYTDISNCTSLHSSYSQRCNCRRCTKTCNTASKTGEKLLHLVGGTYTTLFPPPPNPNGLDKSALLFHPYTWNNCLPRFALLLYQHE